jgi:hypothetical protein
VRDVRSHYIRKNEQARIPNRYVILDTEALRERDKKGETQTWSLAVACFMMWDKEACMTKVVERYSTPEDLWSAISCFTRPTKRTVLYAHNLNYDLRISQALSQLPRLGWTLRDIRLDGRGSWSKWSRDKASLVLCDSASIFPVPLATLAATLGMAKLKLPSCKQRERLFQRCEQDVNILADAITRYVNWLRCGSLGNWQMTGASQAWSHWRHSHYSHQILVHNDEVALAAERAAMHAGRAEAWRWGRQSKGPFHEYDYENSYPRIARDSMLPTRLCGTVTRPSTGNLDVLIRKYAVLADCEVTTDAPCVPAESGGRVVWPVGTFRTTLWDPEIRLLREADATIRVHRAWLYKREPALKEWAEWIISSLHDTSGNVEPWQKLILKHWSRALIGRFGMRYRAWQKFATAKDSRIYTSELWNSETGDKTELMQIGADIFTLGELKEVDDGCPQVTGYIMSEARAKLWRAAMAIGEDNVVYMDTDSLIVNQAGHNEIQRRQGQVLFDGLRSKAKYRNLHIYGPRSYLADKRPFVSGMPRGSELVQGNEWRGEVWQGAGESLRMGNHERVVIRGTTFKLRYNSNRRYYCDDGRTVPYSLPSGAPAGVSTKKRTRFERLIANDYPTLLAQAKAKKAVA